MRLRYGKTVDAAAGKLNWTGAAGVVDTAETMVKPYRGSGNVYMLAVRTPYAVM